MSSDSDFELINTNGEVVEKNKKKLTKKGSKLNTVAQTANKDNENASKNCGKENNASRVNKSKSTRIKKGRKTVRYSEILFCVFSIGVVSAVALFALSKLHIYEPTQKVPESAKERSEDINDGKNFDDHLQNTHDSKRNIPLDEIPVEQAIIGMWFPYDELSTNITDFYTPYHDQDYYGITAFVPGPLQIWRDGPFLYYRTEHPGIHYRILVCFRDGEQCNEDHRRHYRNNTIMQQDIRKRDQSLISRKEYFVKNDALHIKLTNDKGTATRVYLRIPKE